MARKRATAAASKGKTKNSRSSNKATMDTHSPPPTRYHTRSSQPKATDQHHDAVVPENQVVEDIAPTATYPKFKDDLPNAFNGDIDPSKDYISKASVEIIDKIISYLLLDHDPDRGIKVKDGKYNEMHPHVLLSMAAMSRVFYHSVENFTRRLGMKHRRLAHGLPRERLGDGEELRRSGRIASKPQAENRKVYRLQLLEKLQYTCVFCFGWAADRGTFANAVCVCPGCERSEFGVPMVRLPILSINCISARY